MRLIDADELKEAFYKRKRTPDDEKYLRVPAELVYQFIDNAPTVKLEYLPNYAGCESVEMIRVSRPQGKWIDIGNTGACNFCSVCKEFVLSTHLNFCSNCGTKMQRGKEE